MATRSTSPIPAVKLARRAGAIAAVLSFASISATNGLSGTYLIGVIVNIAIGYFFVRLTVRALSAPH